MINLLTCFMGELVIVAPFWNPILLASCPGIASTSTVLLLLLDIL
jgi:hypothetical protein